MKSAAEQRVWENKVQENREHEELIENLQHEQGIVHDHAWA